jgi:hypothetical protein
LVARVLAERLPYPRARELVLAEFERRYVAHVLAEHRGDVTSAAHASGMSRRYFYMLKSRTNR